jgi:hypothetical protein
MQTISTLVTVLGLAAAGCATTRSSPGSFVTDVRIRGDQLEVERCRLDVEVVNRDALRLLLFPLMAVSDDGGGVFTRRVPEVSKCGTQSAPVLGPAPGGAS